MLFARNFGDRVGVSDAAWTRFVARGMTPRLADGLTIVDAIAAANKSRFHQQAVDIVMRPACISF